MWSGHRITEHLEFEGTQLLLFQWRKHHAKLEEDTFKAKKVNSHVTADRPVQFTARWWVQGKTGQVSWGKIHCLTKQAICHQLLTAGEQKSIRRHSHLYVALPAGGFTWGLLAYYKRIDILFLYKSNLRISLEMQHCFLKMSSIIILKIFHNSQCNF